VLVMWKMMEPGHRGVSRAFVADLGFLGALTADRNFWWDAAM
jgi:hypothetical protein